MRVFKDHSFLVFDVDGKQCKYDFATKQAYGFSGRPVKNISSQLRGYTVEQIIQSCDQPGYGYFLKAVRTYYKDSYSNIGTLLDKAREFAKFEPFFTAGVKNIKDMVYFRVPFHDVPTGLLRICREHNVALSQDLVEHYKNNPDIYHIAYSLEYTTLTDRDVTNALSYRMFYYGGSAVHTLIKQYGYTAKSLFLYLDRMATFEALQPTETLELLRDTVQMCHAISPKYDKYPRYLKTTHDIVRRNYDRMKQAFDAEQFALRVKPEMENTIDKYMFIYPKTPQDIKDEAVQQNNCVASYIDRVVRGQCDIVFMRRKDSPERSLVTLEVVGGKVVQRKQRYNNDTTDEQNAIIGKWEAWLQNKAA